MASNWMQQAFVLMATGSLNLSSATIKAMLLRSTYTPNPDHKFVSDLTPGSHECTATNYTGGFGGAGRKALTSKTVTADNATNRMVFSAATPITWASIGGASNNTDLRYVALIRENTSDSDSDVLSILDMGSDKATNGGDLNAAIPGTGLGYVQV